MSRIITLKVDIPEDMYPRLFAAIEKTPPRMRSEKIRSLAFNSELIEGGFLGQSISHESVLKKVDVVKDELEGDKRNLIDPEDFAGFE